MADPNNDPSSVYYIHPSENPGLSLVSAPLTETNYHSWSRAMKVAFLSKNNLQFFDGSLPIPPENDANYTARRRCNSILISWILRSVSSDIAECILVDEAVNAIDVWNDLKERYAEANVLRVLPVQEEMASINQGDKSVRTYFTELKMLWDELDRFRPLPPCNNVTSNSYYFL